MSTHHLHLRAYVCNKCNGPVVATTLSVRKAPISGEIATAQLVASCLLCGDRPVIVDEPGFGFAPIEWPMLSAIPACQKATVSGRALPWHHQQTSGTPVAAPLTLAVGIEPVQ